MKLETINLTFESLIALIQGKKLRVVIGGNHFVFMPPTDGVFVTHKQLQEMRNQDHMRVLSFLKTIGEHRQE